MSAATDLVNQYFSDAQKKLTRLQTAQDQLTDLNAQVAELDRQIKYHNDRGDTTNRDIVIQRKIPVAGDRDAKITEIATLQKSYDDAEALYIVKRNDLLTEEQKAALDNQIKLQNDASAQDLIDKAKQATTNFAQGTTKYLIVGTIIIVIVIIVAVVIRNSKQVE